MSATESKDASGTKGFRERFRVHPAFQYGIAGLFLLFLFNSFVVRLWDYWHDGMPNFPFDVPSLIFGLIFVLVYLEYMINACKPTKAIFFATILWVGLGFAFSFSFEFPFGPLLSILCLLHVVLLLPQRGSRHEESTPMAATSCDAQ